ncbi:hypothetical protein GGX14DRAFT_349655 [Mycena pura]|uniref:BTB domain-containing protein n=1 Tax=Mycena pura TaxID=153505 RepID=A0AAD7E3W2_9AGAR|nr:hypothetical protein GGX14DRAFT_349655 [Mycena pura]
MERLWFEDGSIVLQAGDMQYRVHQSTLTMRSPIFKDMLSLLRSANAEVVDGCPLMHLSDPEVEVTPFLKALFDPQFFLPFPARTNFVAVFACLRLGHKYQVDYLRRRGLVHLSSMFRTTLAEWDGSDFRNTNSNLLPSAIITWPIPDDITYIICSIQLAREVDALWVLPDAFYSLATYFDQLGWNIFRGVVYEGIHAELSDQDKQTFVKGLNKQIAYSAFIIRFLTQQPDIEGCTSQKRCLKLRFRVVEHARELIRVDTRIPLQIWGPEDWVLLEELCPTCLAALKHWHEKDRQTLWDGLPEMYGLPPWNELEQMKSAAIGADLLY